MHRVIPSNIRNFLLIGEKEEFINLNEAQEQIFVIDILLMNIRFTTENVQLYREIYGF